MVQCTNGGAFPFAITPFRVPSQGAGVAPTEPKTCLIFPRGLHPAYLYFYKCIKRYIEDGQNAQNGEKV